MSGIIRADVGVRLLHRHAGLQACHAAIAEVGRVQLRTVEAERQNQLRVAVEEAESGGQYADDLARFAIDDDRLAEHTLIAAELPLPVRVAQHHPLGCLGRIVVTGEMAAKNRVDVEEAQRPVRDEQDLHPLGLAGASDRNGATVPQPDVLEYTPLFSISEVVRRRHVQERDSQPRRGMPQPNEPVGIVERQRLEENAADDAEDGRVGADSERQGEDGDQGEHRRAKQAADYSPRCGSHVVLIRRVVASRSSAERWRDRPAANTICPNSDAAGKSRQILRLFRDACGACALQPLIYICSLSCPTFFRTCASECGCSVAVPCSRRLPFCRSPWASVARRRCFHC